MPITPFHFGPGAALHAIAPRQVSFLAFCAANVIIDVESLYNLVNHRHPVHAFLHTWVGASIVVLATVLLFLALRGIARRAWLPDLFGWRGLGTLQVTLGAAAGAYSHIVLDSVMHADMAPFAPFGTANPLLGTVSLEALHGFCLASAVFGLLLLGVRRLIGSADRAG